MIGELCFATRFIIYVYMYGLQLFHNPVMLYLLCTRYDLFMLENYVGVKVHLNPTYFFHLNRSLHLFEMHFAFLNLILTLL